MISAASIECNVSGLGHNGNGALTPEDDPTGAEDEDEEDEGVVREAEDGAAATPVNEESVEVGVSISNFQPFSQLANASPVFF